MASLVDGALAERLACPVPRQDPELLAFSPVHRQDLSHSLGLTAPAALSWGSSEAGQCSQLLLPRRRLHPEPLVGSDGTGNRSLPDKAACLRERC